MAEPQAPKPAAPAQPAKPVAPAQPAKPAAPSAPELKHLVRVANTDLDGKKTIAFALSNIKGVGISFANAACRIAGINVNKKAGALSDAEVKKVEEVIKNPSKAGFPPWNRHLLSGDLQFTIENDIKTMKKIKCYKGVRHILGQPVRGQRTRSNFRKNKGKVMGVRRSSSAKASSGGTT
jgi:small subunit ribosomal protein S13